MHNTDYCRSLVNWWRNTRPRSMPEMRDHIDSVVASAKMATKFMLPDGGILFFDPKLKAIDTVLPLRLPYPCIALEYEVTKPSIEGEAVALRTDGQIIRRHNQIVNCSKRIVIAREDRTMVCSADGQYDGTRIIDTVVVNSILFVDVVSGWAPLATIYFEAARPIYRDENGRAIYCPFGAKDNLVDLWADYADEVNALFSFLNVLHCGNVEISSAGRTKKRGHNTSALPYDEYHVLTIPSPRASRLDGPVGTAHHRSPREHVRRGHIRICASGIRTWVNAAVVNPGSLGVVDKSYRVEN